MRKSKSSQSLVTRRAAVAHDRAVLRRLLQGDLVLADVSGSLAELAVEHALDGLLFLRASSAGVRIPAALKLRVLDSAATHLRAVSALQRLTPLFTDAGICWCVVKGPVLAEHWYEVAAERSYSDLDVLVAPAQFELALDVLTRAGASLLDRNWSMALRQQRGELSLALPGGTALDLHWSLLNTPRARGQIDLRPAGLLGRSCIVDVAGTPVPTLDPLDTLVHLCVHAVLSGGRQLSWYCDVRRVVERAWLDWHGLVNRARASRAPLAVALVLQRTHKLTGLSVPSEVLAALGARGPWWLRGVDAIDVLRPLGDPRHGRLSAQLVVEATRRSTFNSLGELSRLLRRDLAIRLARDPNHPWRDGPGAAAADNAVTALRANPSDPTDRERFLHWVQSHR